MPMDYPGIVVPALGEIGSADQASVDLVDDLDGVRRRALLGAHLHQLAVFLLRFDQKRALARVVAAGFFNVDVLSGLKSEDGHRRMPVIGRGDRDGVNILALENLAKILLRSRVIAHCLAGLGSELGQDVAFDIADTGDVGRILVGLERREMRIGAAVQPDDGEVEAFVGAEDLAVALGR